MLLNSSERDNCKSTWLTSLVFKVEITHTRQYCAEKEGRWQIVFSLSLTIRLSTLFKFIQFERTGRLPAKLKRSAFWGKQNATRYLRWVSYHAPTCLQPLRLLEAGEGYGSLYSSALWLSTEQPCRDGTAFTYFSCLLFSHILFTVPILGQTYSFSYLPMSDVSCLFSSLPPAIALSLFKVCLSVIALPVSALSFLSGDRPPSFAPYAQERNQLRYAFMF